MRLWMSCDLTFAFFSKINPISRPLPVINSSQPVKLFKSSNSLWFVRYFFSAKKSLDLLYFRFSHVFLDLSWFFVREWDEMSMRGGPRRKIFRLLSALTANLRSSNSGAGRLDCGWIYCHAFWFTYNKILKMNPDLLILIKVVR